MEPITHFIKYNTKSKEFVQLALIVLFYDIKPAKRIRKSITIHQQERQVTADIEAAVWQLIGAEGHQTLQSAISIRLYPQPLST